MLLFFWQYKDTSLGKKVTSKFIHIFIAKSTTALLAPFLNVLMNRVRNQHLPRELGLGGGVEDFLPLHRVSGQFVVFLDKFVIFSEQL